MKNRNTRKREHAPKRHPRRKKVKVYWAESLRSKMLRWIKTGTHGVKLAALGVPLDLMTDQQRQEVKDFIKVYHRLREHLYDDPRH